MISLARISFIPRISSNLWLIIGSRPLFGSASTPRCILPFCLCRETELLACFVTQPVYILLRIVPAYTNYRMNIGLWKPRIIPVFIFVLFKFASRPVLTPGQDPNIAVNLLRGPTEQIPQLSKMKDVHQIPAETEEPGTHIHLKNLKIENLELEYTKPVRKHTIIRQLPQLPISLQLIHSLIISQEREVIVITIKLQNLNKKIILSELSHIHYL